MANGKSKKSKSNPKLRSATFTIVLAVIVISIFTYLILNDGNILPQTGQGKVIATVNGEKITQGELDSEYSKLSEQYQLFLTKEDILNQIIDKKLFLLKAKDEGIVVSELETEEQIDIIKKQFPSEEVFMQILAQQNLTLADIEVQIKDQLIINKLLDLLVFSNIVNTEKEISDYYQENQEQFMASSGQVRAAHILVSSEDEAKEILSQLKDGKEFTSLAVEYSQDPSVEVNGGELGFFSKGTMVEGFEDVAFALKVGEISDIVITQFGFHIIKRLPNKISLSEAREGIVSAIENSKQAEAVDEFLDDLRADADIQIMGEEETSSEDEPVGIIELEEPIIENNFIITSNIICLEEDKPIVRMYTSSVCIKCSEVGQAFRAALADYDVKVMELELDTGDDLYTEEIESSISKEEFEVLKEYNPKGAVPAYVFGCKYVRIGNAYSELNLEGEEQIFKEILDELTS